MKLTEHLTLIKTAANCAELEKRMRAAHEEFPGYPRTFYRIKDAMEDRGKQLCAVHPRGDVIPRFETRTRCLTVCRQSKRVAKGWNGAGVRYAWYYAEQFALDVWRSEGIPESLAKSIWEWWSAGYPHRGLIALDPTA